VKKILIALDYDPTAQKVAEAGFSLATSMGATVVLVHVITDPAFYSSTVYSPIMGFGGYVNLDFLELDLTDRLKKASQIFLDKSKAHLGNTNIETRVMEGDVAEAVMQAAGDSMAELIVMGSHSRKWLDAILMGSVTEKVLHHTVLPLYIVPTKKAVQN
jgi:nucleotide-binding universal stress UspA family protein